MFNPQVYDKVQKNRTREFLPNLVFYLLLVSSLLFSCSSPIDRVDEGIKVVEESRKTMEKTVRTLDIGIDTLGKESKNWRQVLETTRAEITKDLENSRVKITDDVRSTIKNEITDLINHGVATTGTEFRCDADFVGQRMRQALIMQRNELAKQVGISLREAEPRQPKVCLVEPETIDVSRIPNGLNKLKISGYDFDILDVKVLLKNDDREIDVSKSLARLSSYQVILNLGSGGVQLSPNSRMLIVTANGQEVSSIHIIQQPVVPMWVPLPSSGQVPRDAVVGGQVSSQNLYVCRAEYEGALHPGKLWRGNCNIGFGGQEVVLNNYEVLIQASNSTWQSPINRRVPNGTVVGGQASGQNLYVCRAEYEGALHPGKLWRGNCNIGFGGQEVVLDNYEVLVQD
jgi:hypothetical protein